MAEHSENSVETVTVHRCPGELPSALVSAIGEVGETAETGAGGESVLGLSSVVDAVSVVLALLLIVAFAPPLVFDGWTPRFALVVATVPVGIPVLVVLLRRRDGASLCLAAALLWTILAALVSGAPRSALFGFAGRDLSALTVLGAACVWACARQTSDRARALVADVVTWAAAAAALVALLQVLFDVRTGPLTLAAGRPSSFLSNPVYFGAVMSTGLLVVAARLARAWTSSLAPAALLLGIGVSLSGSRVALAAALVAGVALVVVHRSRPALVSLGVVVGSLVVGVGIDRWFGAGRNAADRLAESTGGGRTTVWRYGWGAFLDRPVRGYGFGRFRPAVQARFDLDFVAEFAVDESSQPWFDPHNVIVGLLVAVGVVGTALFVIWGLRCAVSAQGPLAWGIVPILFHWLLQPVSLYTLPLAALLLGAAMPAVVGAAPNSQVSDEEDEELPARSGIVLPSSAWLVGGVVGGLLVGTSFVVADYWLRRTADAGDAEAAAQIARLTADDPVVSNVVSQVYGLDVTADGHLDGVLRWRTASVETEPDRPFWWTQLALAQIETADYIGARRSLDEALRLQPNNPTTTRTMAILAIRSGDRELLADSLDRLCDFDLPDCELTVDELLGPDDESGE